MNSITVLTKALDEVQRGLLFTTDKFQLTELQHRKMDLEHAIFVLQKKSIYIEVLGEGATFNCTDKEDVVKAILEQYQGSDLSIAMFLDSIAIHGLSVTDTGYVVATLFKTVGPIVDEHVPDEVQLAFKALDRVKEAIWDFNNPIGTTDCASERVFTALKAINAIAAGYGHQFVAVIQSVGTIKSPWFMSDLKELVEELHGELDGSFDNETDDARIFDANGETVYVYHTPEELKSDDDAEYITADGLHMVTLPFSPDAEIENPVYGKLIRICPPVEAIVGVTFVSSWSESDDVKTAAKYDPATGKVFDIQGSEDEPQGGCTREFIILPDGSELDVEPDGEDFSVFKIKEGEGEA